MPSEKKAPDQKKAKNSAVSVREAAGAHAKLVASDLWHAVRNERTAQILLALLVVSALCWELPQVRFLFYPFKLFVTTIHESCHALAARFTGGQVVFISVAPDHSGLTGFSGGIKIITMMAGYLGSSIFGGLLIWWGRKPEQARFVLQTVGIIILALTLFYGDLRNGFASVFAVVAMCLIGAGLLLVAKKASDKICHLFLLFLAVITTIEALMDIQTLFLISVFSQSSFSDAKVLQEMTSIPSVVWSLFFGGISLLVLFTSFWLSYRPSRASGTADANQGGASKANAPSAVLLEDSGEGNDVDDGTVIQTPKKEHTES